VLWPTPQRRSSRRMTKSPNISLRWWNSRFQEKIHVTL
jgi:hypothetical protein